MRPASYSAVKFGFCEKHDIVKVHNPFNVHLLVMQNIYQLLPLLLLRRGQESLAVLSYEMMPQKNRQYRRFGEFIIYAIAFQSACTSCIPQNCIAVGFSK